MFDLAEWLLDVTNAFEASGVPYAVCGGLAMAVHGFPRATLDIDVLIPAQDVQSAKAVARGLGFDVEAAPMVFAQGAVVIHRLSRYAPALEEFIPLDLIQVSEPLQSVWDSRARIRIGTSPLWVLSREGLRQMKQLRGSLKDRIDMETLDENP